jgi:hypothetical protein
MQKKAVLRHRLFSCRGTPRIDDPQYHFTDDDT